MAYVGLDVEALQSLDDQYTQKLADYFAPLIPESFVLRTLHEQGEIIVHLKGHPKIIKVDKGNLTFSPVVDVALTNQLLDLCKRILEYKDQLTRYKLEINGLVEKE